MTNGRAIDFMPDDQVARPHWQGDQNYNAGTGRRSFSLKIPQPSKRADKEGRSRYVFCVRLGRFGESGQSMIVSVPRLWPAAGRAHRQEPMIFS